MKKSIILFILFLLTINLFIISLAHAQDLPPLPGIGNINPETGLPEGLEELKDTGEKLTDKEQRSQFLKDAQGKLFKENKYTGPIIKSYEKVSPITDPIFKYTIGLEPSLTWLFFLTLVLWIAFVVYTIRALDLVSIFSKWVQYLIAFAGIIIISISGITKKLAELIINTISLFTIWWVQLIGIVLIIVALMLASIFSKNLKEIFESIKEQKEKSEEELNREQLKGELEIAKIRSGR